MEKIELLLEVIEAFEKANEAEKNAIITNTALMYSLFDLCKHTIGLLDIHGIKDDETSELMNRVIVISKELSENRETHCKLIEQAVNKQSEILSAL